MRIRTPTGLALVLTLFAALPAHAEGNEGKGETANPLLAPQQAVVKKRRPVKKTVKPAMPAAPTPYVPATSNPDIARALTPAPAAATTQADVLPVQPLSAAPAEEVAPPAPPRREISLKCDTRLMDGPHFVSQGVFYIDLFPSAVFPDQQADFKFLFVDPAHRSLIRQTICLDTTCPADVTATAYALISRRTKHGDALRITLDRTSGAFYAEQIDKRLTGGAHLSEQGWCTPQPLPKPLF
jgi:hypothetical protein